MLADEPCRDTQHEPERRKGYAYLPKKIEGHIGVIPDVPVHNNVIEYAHGKLYHCYEKRAESAAFHKSHSSAAVYGIEDSHDTAACQAHRPVGVAAEDYLYKAVAEVTHKERKQKL